MLIVTPARGGEKQKHVAWMLTALGAGTALCAASTAALALNFPSLFVYVQILVFVLQAGALPSSIIDGVHLPNVRALDFWAAGILLLALGLAAAIEPRRASRAAFVRAARSTPSAQRLCELGLFIVGLQTALLGLILCWTGSHVPPFGAHASTQRGGAPANFETPHLARVLLVLV